MKRATHATSKTAKWIAVSIHALVKRATQGVGVGVGVAMVSIHALVKRATRQKSRKGNRQ